MELEEIASASASVVQEDANEQKPRVITVPVFKTRPGSLGSRALRMIVARRALTHPLAVRYESVLAGKQ